MSVDNMNQEESHHLLRGGWVRVPVLVAAMALGMTGAMSLSGCETAEGAGRDIQTVGEGLEDLAD